MLSLLLNFFLVASWNALVDSFTFPFAKNSNSNAVCIVQVCQNKDCCKRWSMTYQRLPEILQDLLPPDVASRVEVETTGCFSLCGKGPNICMKKSGSQEVYLNGITGPMTLADDLEEHLSIKIPSKLVAAVTVMEKAQKAPLTEKDKFYSSIIQVLSADSTLGSSLACTRAFVLRAQSRHEEGRWDEARKDAESALQIHRNHLSFHPCSSVVATAWRTLADCCVSQGQLDQAVQALQQWARADPSYQTKAAKEIEHLLTINDVV